MNESHEFPIDSMTLSASEQIESQTIHEHIAVRDALLFGMKRSIG